MSLKVLSPAKVNLFLRVLRKRPDGYHDIYSLMQPVSLFDEVTIDLKEGRGITVSSDNSALPDGPENLAYRGASLFLKTAGIERSVKIHIRKRIPVGGGLGGGSSNAASVLLGLNALTGACLDEDVMLRTASGLGADVPFFILKSGALATGTGTTLQKVNLPEIHYVLVNPGFHVSTAWVYSNLDLTKKTEDNILTYSFESIGGAESLKGLLYNDLEAVTLKRHPELGKLKRTLVDNGAIGALMSGSGPTVFGMFKDGDTARKASVAINASLDERSLVFAVKGI